MSSPSSLENVPDAVIQSHVMAFLGPRFLLPTMGSTSKRYRQLARSDPVWQQFCSWHGPEASKMLQKLLHGCQENHENVWTEKLTAVRGFYEAFAEASRKPNAMRRYKELCDGKTYWSQLDNNNLECYLCAELGVEGAPQASQNVCAWPSCRHTACNRPHFSSSQVIGVTWDQCHWCKITFCPQCAFESDKGDLAACGSCDRYSCLDCRSILEQICRKCAGSLRDEELPCLAELICEACAFQVEGTGANAQSLKVCSGREFAAVKDIYCQVCAEEEIQRREESHALGIKGVERVATPIAISYWKGWAAWLGLGRNKPRAKVQPIQVISDELLATLQRSPP